MGDEWKGEFSREELEAMGEEVPRETPGPETQATEETQETETEQKTLETEESAKTGEEEKGETEEAEEEEQLKEGEPVPYDRFSKVYGRAKQTEREREELKEKLDLFKRSPDEYYAKYPDEKPEGYQAPQQAKEEQKPVVTEILPMRKMMDSTVNDPDNQDYNGKTLRELMNMGPEGQAAAFDYYQEYANSVRDQVRAAKEKEKDALRSLKEEDSRFMDGRAKELFQKDYGDLDETGQKQVDGIVSEILSWMKKNNRMAYKLEDAWKIMTYDKTLNDAMAKGAKSLVDHAKKTNLKSIGTGAGGTSTDPYASYLAMSEKDLEDKIRLMPDVEYEKFLKDATPAFKKKFPALPY